MLVLDVAEQNGKTFGRHVKAIEEIDRHGPTLRSIIEVNPDTMEIAAERDREREAGQVRGCLHGLDFFGVPPYSSYRMASTGSMRAALAAGT